MRATSSGPFERLAWWPRRGSGVSNPVLDPNAQADGWRRAANAPPPSSFYTTPGKSPANRARWPGGPRGACALGHTWPRRSPHSVPAPLTHARPALRPPHGPRVVAARRTSSPSCGVRLQEEGAAEEIGEAGGGKARARLHSGVGTPESCQEAGRSTCSRVPGRSRPPSPAHPRPSE